MLNFILSTLARHAWTSNGDIKMCAICGRTVIDDGVMDPWGPPPVRVVSPGIALKHWTRPKPRG